MPQQFNRRRAKFVSSLIQGRMLAKLCVYWCVYHFVLWHFMFAYQFLQYRVLVLGGAPAKTFLELYAQFCGQNWTLLMCAVGVFPMIFWDMLKVTHHVAGPLVQFKRALKELSEGKKVDRIVLRRGDMLTDLQDSFNEYLNVLNSGNTNGSPVTPAAESELEDKVAQQLGSLQSEVESATKPAELTPSHV